MWAGLAMLPALAMLLCAATARAGAIDELNPDRLTALAQATNDAITDILKTFVLGVDHRAYEPASPLGLKLGIDAGVDVTGVPLSEKFKKALSLMGQQSLSFDTLPLPRLNLHKGLPFGIDAGVSFLGYAGDPILVGAELKWAFARGPTTPNLAVRASLTYAKVRLVVVRSGAVDGVFSRRVGSLVEPYFGGGLQYGSGQLLVDLSQIPVSIPTDQTFLVPRAFAGLAFRFVVVKLVGELLYNFGGTFGYGVKASISI